MMKKKISELLLQIIPVMIGVYLAFLVSNWADQQKRVKQGKNLLTNIKSEIKSNKKLLGSILDYHTLLRDSSYYYLSNLSKINIHEPPSFFKGTRTTSLMKSAYATGNQTGIVNEFDINTIQKLNRLYTYQEEYNEYIRMTLEGIINKELDEDLRSFKKALQFLAITMTDIVIKEENLIQEYDQFLVEVK